MKVKKTLSLGAKSRKPAGKPTPGPAKSKTLLECLEALLENEQSVQSDIPPVRLKSTEGTYNPNQERIILIRRNPYAKTSEYERVISQVNFRSLKQWCQAGIGSLYPQECREEAELDFVDAVHGEMRAKYKDSRNLYFKHLDAVAKLNDEIAYEHKPCDPEYKRAQWDVQQTEIELDKVAAVENMERYQKLESEMRQGNIVTAKGRQMVLQAMILALCDALPTADKTHLPERLRHNLRTAMAEKQVLDAAQFAPLAELPVAEEGISRGLETTIRDDADRLVRLITGIE
jgi:hypothetical protein